MRLVLLGKITCFHNRDFLFLREIDLGSHKKQDRLGVTILLDLVNPDLQSFEAFRMRGVVNKDAGLCPSQVNRSQRTVCLLARSVPDLQAHINCFVSASYLRIHCLEVLAKRRLRDPERIF